MCDYSLHALATRPAKVGETLISTTFRGTSTRGFASEHEPAVAVCMLPGTELAFEAKRQIRQPLDLDANHRFPRRQIQHHRSAFRERHHDAIEFPDGSYVLVTQLCAGQRATVLQLPVVHPVSERKTKEAGTAPADPAFRRLNSASPVAVRRLQRSLLLGLKVGFRWRGIDRARRRHARREDGCFRLAIACDRRRPRPVDSLWLDRIDDKPSRLRRSAIAPCRRRRSASMTEASARSRRLPCGHDQRGAFAIIRQRLGPQRQRDEAAAGGWRHAAACVAGDALGQRGIGRHPRIGVRRQPLLHQETIFGRPHQMQPSVLAADADVAAIGGNQNVRLRRPHRPHHGNQQARPRRTSAAASATGRAG